MNIRLEQPEDYREVENLTREAFWNVYRPGCVEHYVLNQYRTNPDFIPDLDFVMEEDGCIIGHVMYSKAELSLEDGTKFPIWTFGPISIHPDNKRKGYGLKLLNYSMELIPGYLKGIEGTYCTPKGYFVADENTEAFETYESTFPAKEKDFNAQQLPQFCQSCGMPLTSKEDCGTNADGSTSFDYCKYCYNNGKFLQECTMEEMINHCAQFVGMYNQNTGRDLNQGEYKKVLRGFFPMLKRWKY